MIGMDVADALDSFFDRTHVVRKLDQAKKRMLTGIGARTMTRARRSLKTPGKRKAKNYKATPGKPPASWTGLLKQFIFFVYEPRTESVMIGPADFKESSDTPELLEYGGSATRRVPIFDWHPDDGTPWSQRKGKRKVVDYKNMAVDYPAYPYMQPPFDEVVEEWDNYLN